MSAAITLGALAEMERDALLALWPELIGGLPPKSLSQPFLRRFLAFALQSRKHGGLPKGLVAQLGKIDRGEVRPKSPGLRAGGRLLREWNGVSHVVDVTAEGYLWNGARHRSLSAIARAITGAHWSGPRFFGLQDAKARAKS